ERLGTRRLAGLEGQLLDLGLRLPQQTVAMVLQRLAALIDVDALFELNVAPLQPADDALELLQRLLEGHVLDVAVLYRTLCFLCIRHSRSRSDAKLPHQFDLIPMPMESAAPALRPKPASAP